jgi:hypothetical protein
MPQLFEVEYVSQVVKVKSTKKNELYSEEQQNNSRFDHNAYGINRAVLAGESIIKNRGNSI